MLNHAHQLNQATDFLASLDADWAKLIATVGPCKLTAKIEQAPYQALMRAVAYQQLHAKAGDAILKKLGALLGKSNVENAASIEFPSAAQVIAAEVADLRACGFSTRKIETLKSIAQGALSGLVPSFSDAQAMSDQQLIDRLTTLKGIGQWTVEMMLMFNLARMDVLPANDLAIVAGYQRLKGLAIAPKPKAMAQIALAWRPYRSVASWYLWRVPKH